MSEEYINYGDSIGKIEQLPSAQPEKRTEERTKTHGVCLDTISRQAAINALHTWFRDGFDEDKWWNSTHVLAAIEGIPPAEPKIIYCKDCKYWIPYDWMFSEVWQSRNIADYSEDEIGCACSDMAMKAVDFCSRAERR